MKNWAIVFLISSLLSAIGFSQEHGAAPADGKAPAAHGDSASHGSSEAKHDEHGGGDPLLIWKIANFGILAAGLGYLASKHLPAFFADRNAEIQKDLAEARQLKAESDAKAAAMEQRMAKLGAEIEALRSEGKAQIAAEGDRIRKETETAVSKLQATAEAEIESMTKAAKHELKNYSVQLAMDLATDKIRSRSNMESNLFNRFVADLEKKGANN